MLKIKSNFSLAIGWTLFISLLLCLPGSEFPKITWLSKIWFDKWVHIFIFFILVSAWCLAIKEKYQQTLSKNIFLQITILSLCYGIVMELVQHFFIPFRGFEFLDIMADGAGCAAGYFASVRRLKK